MASVTCSASPFKRPLSRTLTWGAGQELHELNHVLITVGMGSATGYAEAVPRPMILNETVESVCAFIEEIAPHVPPELTRANIDAFSDELFATEGNLTAKASLNCALYELLAAVEGTTVPELLGMTPKPVRACYILGHATPEALVEEIRTRCKEGVRGFKVKLTGDTEKDATILAVLREETDCTFYVDGNQLYSREQAAELLQQFPQNVLYMEEPLPIADLEERKHLVAATQTPIIGDDSCTTFAHIKEQIKHKTISMVNLKVPRAGFTEGRKILNYCQEHNIPVMIGSHAGYQLAAYHAYILACHPAATSNLHELIYWLNVPEENRPELVDGTITFTQRPEVTA
ncbi:MAG: hypothetical protein OXR66_07345 [Candidatus Woesearchaeota archaeon]|nr:hypothetical protein [Candidatus Woesearchaeota archaeon]